MIYICWNISWSKSPSWNQLNWYIHHSTTSLNDNRTWAWNKRRRHQRNRTENTFYSKVYFWVQWNMGYEYIKQYFFWFDASVFYSTTQCFRETPAVNHGNSCTTLCIKLTTWWWYIPLWSTAPTRVHSSRGECWKSYLLIPTRTVSH